MEFIATYGWALLIVVVVISIVLQMGVFNSLNYVRPGDEVTGFNSFDVSDTLVLESGDIQMSMSNKLGEPVTITEILVDDLPLASVSPALPLSLPAGGRVTITGESAAGGRAGEIYHAKVSVKFDVQRGTSDHRDSGTLRGELQPGKTTGKKACSDGIDNDNDGLIDYPADPGCENPNDGNEADNPHKQCNDGMDNDNDGLTDYPLDPGCSGPSDDDEANAPVDSCGDSDGGIIYNVSGTVSGYYGGSAYSYTDSCASGINLNEYYCSGTSSSSTTYACTDMGANYICSEGKCVYSAPPPPDNNCSDSDGGLVYNVTGAALGYYNGSFYEYIDSCSNSSSLTEYFCSATLSNSTLYACGNMGANYTCSGGKCILNQTPPSSNCTDSDSSLPMYLGWPAASQISTYGTCTDASGTFTDISVNSTILNEFYCGPTSNPTTCMNTTWYNCLYWNYTGSSGGKCVRENASYNNNCSDSDGGQIYNVTGTASGYYNNTPYSYTDSCYNSTWVNEQFCSATRSNSTPYWCINMGVNYTCSSGRCVLNQTPPANNSCSDSDGGQIYNVTGTVNGTYNGTPYSYTDQCFGSTTLYEHYCTGTTNHSEMFTCANMGANYTCSGGKCILNQSGPANNCSDTDGGIVYNISGVVSGYLGGAPYSHSDYCSGTYLAEQYCQGTVNMTDWHSCVGNYTCSNNACTYSPPPPPNNSCSDSDGGQIYNVTGTVNGTYNGTPYSYTDYCASGTNLNEYYCSGTSNASTVYACTNMGANYTCSSGKCVLNQSGSSNCTDTDSYLSVAKKYPLASQIGVYANCTDAGGTFADTSLNATFAKEYYCVSNTCYSTNYNCPSYNYTGSSGGKCYK